MTTEQATEAASRGRPRTPARAGGYVQPEVDVAAMTALLDGRYAEVRRLVRANLVDHADLLERGRDPRHRRLPRAGQGGRASRWRRPARPGWASPTEYGGGGDIGASDRGLRDPRLRRPQRAGQGRRPVRALRRRDPPARHRAPPRGLPRPARHRRADGLLRDDRDRPRLQRPGPRHHGDVRRRDRRVRHHDARRREPQGLHRQRGRARRRGGGLRPARGRRRVPRRARVRRAAARGRRGAARRTHRGLRPQDGPQRRRQRPHLVRRRPDPARPTCSTSSPTCPRTASTPAPSTTPTAASSPCSAPSSRAASASAAPASTRPRSRSPSPSGTPSAAASSRPPTRRVEDLILDYGMHQRRLFPLLARTYALHFAQENVAQQLHEVFSGPPPTGGEEGEQERRRLESDAAGTQGARHLARHPDHPGVPRGVRRRGLPQRQPLRRAQGRHRRLHHLRGRQPRAPPAGRQGAADRLRQRVRGHGPVRHGPLRRRPRGRDRPGADQRPQAVLGDQGRAARRRRVGPGGRPARPGLPAGDAALPRGAHARRRGPAAQARHRPGDEPRRGLLPRPGPRHRRGPRPRRAAGARRVRGQGRRPARRRHQGRPQPALRPARPHHDRGRPRLVHGARPAHRRPLQGDQPRGQRPVPQDPAAGASTSWTPSACPGRCCGRRRSWAR